MDKTKIGRLKNFINSRIITGALTTTLMVLGIAWYLAEGGTEPLMAAVGGVLSFVGLFKYSFLSFDRNLTTSRIALVIGNDSYAMGVLPNVQKDVEAICQSLHQKGFKVIKRENPSRQSLIKSIYDFQAILSAGGVGFFYYAGHAAQVDGRDHILPVDVRVKSRADFSRYAIDLNSLLRPVDKIIEESPNHNGSVVIYSTSSGAQAIDYDEEFKEHSPFAMVFIELMERWNLEVFDLFRLLCRKVSDITKGTQVPWLSASLNVEFYFKPIIREQVGVLKVLVFDACRNNPFARTPLAFFFEQSVHDAPITAAVREAEVNRIVSAITSGEPTLAEPLQALNYDDNMQSILILFLGACPIGMDPIDLSGELREIQGAIKDSQLGNRFRLAARLSVTPRTLLESLVRTQPQFIHFSGHGSLERGLVVEPDHGDFACIGWEALGKAIGTLADRVECVVLNVSGSQAAIQFISPKIPYVISAGQSISDDAAIAFSAGFYQALANGREIEDAFHVGCAQIALEGLSPEDASPVLHCNRRKGKRRTLNSTGSPAPPPGREA